MTNKTTATHLIDKNTDYATMASLLIQLDAFVSIEAAEIITTLDKTTQYRERCAGRFPKPVNITAKGRRKAYRLKDVKEWLNNPLQFKAN